MKSKVSVVLDPGVTLEVTRRGGEGVGFDFTSGYPADIWLNEYGPRSRENLENLILRAERVEDENAQSIYTSVIAPVITIFAIVTTLLTFAVQGIKAGSVTYPLETSVKEISLSVHAIALCLSESSSCPKNFEGMVTAEVEPSDFMDRAAVRYVELTPVIMLNMLLVVGVSTIYSARRRDRGMRYARAWKRFFKVHLDRVSKE